MGTREYYMDMLKQHADEVQARFGITSMRMFGSVARNEHSDGSDVDLFVTMPPQFYNYIAASQYLQGLLGCNVDLIRSHKNLRPFFKKQIEEDGVDVFTAGAGH